MSRSIVRVNSEDFLKISSIKGTVKKDDYLFNINICFDSPTEWRKGQELFIDYFLAEALDSIELVILVLWSEFISPKVGYFIGGEVIKVQDIKKSIFMTHFVNKHLNRGGYNETK